MHYIRQSGSTPECGKVEHVVEITKAKMAALNLFSRGRMELMGALRSKLHSESKVKDH